MKEEVASVLRDGLMVVNTVMHLQTGPVEEIFQTSGVVRVVTKASSASRDGSRTPQSVLSDAQLLCWALVDDGVLPDVHITYFTDLMASVESAAARQARLCAQVSK